ncbi:hypothetical protein [Sphingomonas metalli]|nr:hypothetical protein [Sphingomonas metalli]
MLLLTLLVLGRAEPRAPGREALTGAALPDLAEEAVMWIASQRRGLPPPALDLAGSLGRRLDGLVPRLAWLDPRSPEAASIRKLVARELPDLVEGWRAVPVSARRVPHANGRTPEDDLINGLQLIDAELARAAGALGRSSSDAIAVQGRYLDLKYGQDERLP